MNIFRLAGDMSHVFSIVVLLLRLRVAKNAQGKFEIWCKDIKHLILTFTMLSHKNYYRNIGQIT